MTQFSLFVAFAVAVAGTPALALAQSMVRAQAAGPACAAPAEIPAWLSGWSTPVPMAAAARERALGAAQLTPGQAVTLTLLQTPRVSYPLRPEKPGGTVSYGGLVRFTVAEEGIWRVALGSGAWIDVVKGGTALQSVAHGPGPDCSGIRKMVDFHLTPGSYTLQLAANGTDSLVAMVARQP